MTKLKSLSNALSRVLVASPHQPRSFSHSAMQEVFFPDEPEGEATIELGDRTGIMFHDCVRARGMINRSGTTISCGNYCVCSCLVLTLYVIDTFGKLRLSRHSYALTFEHSRSVLLTYRQ